MIYSYDSPRTASGYLQQIRPGVVSLLVLVLWTPSVPPGNASRVQLLLCQAFCQRRCGLLLSPLLTRPPEWKKIL